VNEHPVRLRVEDDLRRSRLTVFFRLLLAIPLLIWLAVWSIGVVFASLFGWFAALFTGRLPAGLHNFLAAYVRYTLHVSAYIGLTANPYPSFTGEPGYPVDVVIPGPERQSRWKTAFRLVLGVPALILAGVLGSGSGGGSASTDSKSEWLSSTGIGGVAAVCAFLGWFAAMATGRMPLGLRDLGAYGVGYAAQANAYLLLLTDRYPNSDPEALGPAWSLPEHPVRLELADDGRRSRLTVFFRLLLAFPHFVWITLWSVAAFFAGVANWFAALVRGSSPEPLHRFLAAFVRYSAHLDAYLFLVANPFPGFTGRPGYPVDVTIPPAEPQNRTVIFFRIFLAIPAFILTFALNVVLLVVGLLGWFAALVTGRMPTGLRNLGAVTIRYLAQTNAYAFVLTERYPFAGPALRPPPEPDLVAEPVEAVA
jgi:hypothetical protein